MTERIPGRILDMAALTEALRQAMGGLRDIPVISSITINGPFQKQVLGLMGEYGKYNSPHDVTYMASERVTNANWFLHGLGVSPQFERMPPGSVALGSHTLIELTLPNARLIALDSPRGGTFPALEVPLDRARFYRARGSAAVRAGSYVVKLSLGSRRELWLYQAATLPRKPDELFHDAWQLGVGGSVVSASLRSYSSLQIPRFDGTMFGPVHGLAGLHLGVNADGHVKQVGHMMQLATLRIKSSASNPVDRDENKPLRFDGPLVAFTTLPAGRDRIIGTVMVIEDPATLT